MQRERDRGPLLLLLPLKQSSVLEVFAATLASKLHESNVKLQTEFLELFRGKAILVGFIVRHLSITRFFV